MRPTPSKSKESIGVQEETRGRRNHSVDTYWGLLDLLNPEVAEIAIMINERLAIHKTRDSIRNFMATSVVRDVNFSQIGGCYCSRLS